MLHLDPSCIGRVWPAFMWTVAVVSALGCCMGFHEFVWFMSVGYGFSVMCIGLFHLIFCRLYKSVTNGINGNRKYHRIRMLCHHSRINNASDGRAVQDNIVEFVF